MFYSSHLLSWMIPFLLATPNPVPSGAAVVEAEEEWRQEIFARLVPSVVFISHSGSFGSGFFVTDDGLVLTNAHVVGDANEVTSILHDGRKLTAKVVERLKDIDLALIQVPIKTSRAIPLVFSDRLRVGAWVGAISHGHGAIWTFNTGIVSNIYPDGNARPVFQTQIPLNPGSSGGPIFDRQGHVVGIVTAGLAEANNINFGIKIDVALRKLKQLSDRCACLRIRAPENVAVYVDGVLAGTGPLIIIPDHPDYKELSAVIGNKLVRHSLVQNKSRSVNLMVPAEN